MRFALLLGCCLLAFCTSLGEPRTNAQETMEPGNEARLTESATPVPLATETSRPWLKPEAAGTAAPDVYLLPDASGQLRKVLGFRYNDFLDAWQRAEGSQVVSPPRYVLDGWKVSGEVGPSRAEVRIEVELTTHAEDWIEVPLRLADFVVQRVTIDSPTTGENLTFDAQRGGYVLWLVGKVGQKRKITLEGLTRLQTNASNRALLMHLPRATAAQFSLQFPNTAARFTTASDLELIQVEQPDGSTEIQLIGQASPMQLQWSFTERESSAQPSLIEVESATTVNVNSRRLAYEAKLTIVSLANQVQQIQVRLPVGAKLHPIHATRNYEIANLTSAESSNRYQTVTIRRSTPSNRPWEVKLAAQQALDPGAKSRELSVEGFEVLNAFRHSGTLRLEVDEQLQAYFDKQGDIEQTPSKALTAAVRGQSVLGAFRFTSFPWSLTVHASPRERRVSVRPDYEMRLSAEEAELDVQYLYEMTGAQIFSLRIDLGGWELTEAPIESGGVIDLDGVIETRDGRLVMPLVDSDTQQLRVNLRLRKSSKLGQISVLLPEPLGAIVEEGEFVVRSNEALQVVPKFNEMKGLSLLAEESALPEAETTRGVTRAEDRLLMRTFLARPSFVAEVKERPPLLLAEQQTQVEVDVQGVRVRQQIDYQAKFRPVDQVSVLVPETLRENASLRCSLEGEPLVLAWDRVGLDAAQQDLAKLVPPFSDASGKPSSSANLSSNTSVNLVSATVTLPRPMLGAIALELNYELPVPGFNMEETTQLELPLVAPAQSVSNHKLTVEATSPVVATLNQRSGTDAWQVESDALESERVPSKLTLHTDTNISLVSLYTQLDSSERLQLATLERGWIQSWITSSQRQERVVFRFRTAYDQVLVQFSQEFDSSNIEVLLDGAAWRHELLSDSRLAVLLPGDQPHESHTLELRYHNTSLLPSFGTLRSQLPKLVCRETSVPVYWQLVLPRGWVMSGSPQGLIPDYWLGWKNYRWGRQPTLSQAHLEQITGATSATTPSPLAVSYVYRAFEMPEDIEVFVLRRAWILLLGSLLTFGIGLCWLSTTLLSNGAVWLGFSIALLAGVFSYPEITILAIQVILVGGAMTLTTSILRRVFLSAPSSRQATDEQRDQTVQLQRPWQVPESAALSKPETTTSMPTGEPTS